MKNEKIVVRNPLAVALTRRSPGGGRHSSRALDVRKGRAAPKHKGAW